MDDVRRELAGLRRRVRLQAIASVGALVVLCFAMGGADATARALVDVDAWTIKTKDAGGALTTRLTCTTDVATAKIKVQNANLHLAPQSSMPSGMDAGALGYDSTVNKFKYYNGTAWEGVESGIQTGRVTGDQAIASTTLTDIAGLSSFSLSANTVYRFRAVVYFVTSASTVGMRYAVNFTGTVAYLRCGHYNPTAAPANSNTMSGGAVQTVNNTAIFATTTGPGTTKAMCIIEGLIEVGATGGTLSFRHASETGASNTTERGSFAAVQAVP